MPSRYCAAIYEKGEIVESFDSDCGIVRRSFDKDGVSIKFDEKKRILHAVDPEVPEYTVTADFNAKTVTAGFDKIIFLHRLSKEQRHLLYDLPKPKNL